VKSLQQLIIRLNLCTIVIDTVTMNLLLSVTIVVFVRVLNAAQNHHFAYDEDTANFLIKQLRSQEARTLNCLDSQIKVCFSTGRPVGAE
jgi:hypothetical protein